VYGQAVITLITVQNTRRVTRVHVLDADLVREQIQAVFEDLPPHAAKTGALGNREIVEAVAEAASECACPLIVDPVMISKHGAPLMAESARTAMRDKLVPRAYLVMPNLHEAAALTGIQVGSLAEMYVAARQLLSMGCENVLLKGGHLSGPAAVDLLVTSDGAKLELRSERIDTRHTHGTGCTYSAAITALLASGIALTEAVTAAKAYISRAIESNPGLGGGAGPVNHFA
jgi:hydroxymethylpyrimidine/phosphomethylpyrimidine kinase